MSRRAAIVDYVCNRRTDYVHVINFAVPTADHLELVLPAGASTGTHAHVATITRQRAGTHSGNHAADCDPAQREFMILVLWPRHGSRNVRTHELRYVCSVLSAAVQLRRSAQSAPFLNHLPRVNAARAVLTCSTQAPATRGIPRQHQV